MLIILNISPITLAADKCEVLHIPQQKKTVMWHNLLSQYRCLLCLECKEKLKLTLKTIDTFQPI